ncbi:MAG: M56 family metallopeptidase [Bacteroidaceae bacterium]|nr:M56 family metallopeptidase [Bacteroidaceae bacterium]
MIYFLLKSAILLSVLYGCFFVLLSRETFHKFNRGVLLVILVSSLLLPTWQVRMDKSPFMPEWAYRPADILSADGWENIPETYSQASKETEKVQHPSATQITKRDIPSSNATFPWHIIPYCIYLLGVAWHVLSILRQIQAFRHDAQHGIKTKDKYDNTIIIRGGNFAPYSFFRYIVISAKDYEDSRQAILTHEQAHIRLGHSWDILLLEAVCTIQWFNPLVWMLARDLRAVHEYEADKAVLDLGIDATRYQQLLVIKAFGTRLQSVTNSLSHGSLKDRIIMMKKTKSSGLLMLKGLFLPLFMGIAVVAFAKPKTEDYTIPSNGDTVHGISGKGNAVRVKFEEEKNTANHKFEERMVEAVFLSDEQKKDPIMKKYGDFYRVSWTKGAWIEAWGKLFVEDRPKSEYPFAIPAKKTKMLLDGVEFDLHHVPDLPASALKKIEHSKEGEIDVINLITKHVEIPAGIKGNINPQLTILLTGTPPKDASFRVSIFQSQGIKETFDHKQYEYISWTQKSYNIKNLLKDISYRKDHHIRINVCHGAPQEHIKRLTAMLKECGLTNYDFVYEK